MPRLDKILIALATIALIGAAAQQVRARDASAKRARHLSALSRVPSDAALIARAGGNDGAEAGSVPPSRVASEVAIAMELAGLASQTAPSVSATESATSGGVETRRRVSFRIDLPALSEPELGRALSNLKTRLQGWTCTVLTLNARQDRSREDALYTASLTLLGYADDR